MISLSFLLLFLPCQDPEPVLVSPDAILNRVTVYDGQALVERVFHVQATSPGPYDAVLGPLPLGLDASSLLVKVEQGSAVVQGVEPRIVVGAALDDTSRDALREELSRLKGQRRALDGDRESIASGRGFVNAVVSSISSEEASPDHLTQVMVFVRAQAASLDKELAANELAVADLDLQIQTLQNKLGDGGRKMRRYAEGHVRIWFEQAGTASFRLSYLVPGARWLPTYDVRVFPDLTGVTVGLIAQVSQKTGEDWEDAEILLSTAAPSVGLDPPAVPVRTVYLPRPLAQKAPSAPSAKKYGGRTGGRLESLGIVEEDLSELEFARLDAPTVSVQNLGLSVLFSLPQRKAIASTGEVHRFRIREVPLDVEPERYLVPSLSDRAFLRAKVTLTGDAPLLPGPAKIFLGPDYLGQASFPILRPGDETTLQLGVDPNLTLKVETVLNERRDPGLLSSTATLTRVRRAVLKLSASAPRDLVVVMEEFIPVSRDNRVTVKAVEMRPAPEHDEEALKLQKEKGLYGWRLKLAPGETRNVYWGWAIEFDEDDQLVFGEE